MNTKRFKTTSDAAMSDRPDAESLADFVMFAQRSCLLDISRDLSEGKVSYGQFFLLGYLGREGVMTMSDIARKMGHSTAAATGLVDRLEKLGYVVRLHAEEDRRKIMVRITDEGQALVGRMREGIATNLAKTMKEMEGEFPEDLRESVRKAGSLIEAGK